MCINSSVQWVYLLGVYYYFSLSLSLSLCVCVYEAVYISHTVPIPRFVLFSAHESLTTACPVTLHPEKDFVIEQVCLMS